MINLGVDLPVSEYAAAVVDLKPDALALSFVLSRNINKRFEELSQLRGRAGVRGGTEHPELPEAGPPLRPDPRGRVRRRRPSSHLIREFEELVEHGSRRARRGRARLRSECARR